MGYGVMGEYITEATAEVWEKKILAVDYEVGENENPMDVKKVTKEETINVFNLFREPPENKTEEEIAGGQ